MKTYKVKANVWEYPGMSGWHFVHIGKELSVEIKEKYNKKKRGFGSIPVSVSIGKSKWETSIFPSKREGSYMMPIKASVRKSEGIYSGDDIIFSFNIRNT